ncbi:MAG: hypothetical protein JXR16_09200 [Bermanella sp.]
MKTLSKAVAIASLVSASALSAQTAFAEVEVSASAAVSNMYLWRGLDLGKLENSDQGGVPAISGDLSVSTNGAYAGVWASSGDANLGTEYDLYVGYGMEAGDVSVDLMLASYIYPSNDAGSDTMFDGSEAILSLGFMDASFSLYETITSNPSDNRYITLGYGIDAVSATLGMQMSDDDTAEYTHVDVSYAYNDNLSFTYSQIVDEGVEGSFNTNGLVVATYSMSIQ